MQPRGQLWFGLERMCQDFKEFSGLERAEALKTLIIVLGNMKAEQEEELASLNGGQGEQQQQ